MTRTNVTAVTCLNYSMCLIIGRATARDAKLTLALVEMANTSKKNN
jgi:hypothetical protein